jgi:hypothetical protein
MANPQQVGSFVPTTNIFAGEQQIASVEFNTPEFRQLLVNLYQIVGLMATVVNTKDSAWYAQSEFVNGQVWFPNPSLNSTSQLTPTVRQVFRKVINFGGLPNAGTTSIPHLIPITSAVTFTRIYATASDTAGKNYIPIPYVDPAGTNIQINVDATNVNITTVDDRTNYTVCYVVLEYIKS